MQLPGPHKPQATPPADHRKGRRDRGEFKSDFQCKSLECTEIKADHKHLLRRNQPCQAAGDLSPS